MDCVYTSFAEATEEDIWKRDIAINQKEAIVFKMYEMLLNLMKCYPVHLESVTAASDGWKTRRTLIYEIMRETAVTGKMEKMTKNLRASFIARVRFDIYPRNSAMKHILNILFEWNRQ